MADVAQPQTEEWVAQRLGKLTASRMGDIVGRKKNGDYYQSRTDYMLELIAERLTGMVADKALFGPMLWGIETEPAAIKAYERLMGETVTKNGFVDHPQIPGSGCTPDAFVGYDGLLEVKCPETRTHVRYLIGGVVPEDYLPQMHWQMACTGRKWCDFVSFDYRGTMPEHLKLFRVRLMRDEKQIAAYEKDAKEFLSELSWTLQRIESGHVESGDVA